jgi:hypothetical protein
MQNESEQQDLTFQPKVNLKSAKIAVIKRQEQDNEDVVERLYNDAANRIEKVFTHHESINE